MPTGVGLFLAQLAESENAEGRLYAIARIVLQRGFETLIIPALARRLRVQADAA